MAGGRFPDELERERSDVDAERMGRTSMQVRRWLADNWDTSITLREWWARLYDAGYAFPTWPVGFGGTAVGANEAKIIIGELRRAMVIGPPSGVGQALGSRTVLAHGTRKQQETWIPALARGEEAWAQLFSEPGAGSDLASLATRAVRDGDEWIINGQKVWSSGAETAERGMLLARTNLDAPKHKGITYFIIDLDQPGVDVRPLRQLDGRAHFCEVFFESARVATKSVLGEVDDGWRVAQTTLSVERSGADGADVSAFRMVAPGRKAGNLDRLVVEVLDALDSPPRPTAFYLPAEVLIGIARERSLADDPVTRQQLVSYYIHAEVLRLTGLRMTAALAQGRVPGVEASTMKLALGNCAKRFRATAMHILGAHGMLADGDAPEAGQVHAAFYWSLAANIGGGTDEIQRNVIGERALKLPREPAVDRDTPYRQLRFERPKS